MEILTAAEMRNVDRRAIEELGIPSLTLMEGAGRAVTDALLSDHPDADERGMLVVCGKGNNGGDGLVVARLLLQIGIAPEVIVLAAEGELSPDALHNLRAARDAGVNVEHVLDAKDWARVEQRTTDNGIVIDAILGTGITGGARGLAKTVIDSLNETGRHVVAVDLPSGLDADRGRVEGSTVRAAITYTLCRPKRALVLPPASELAGTFRVLPIGIPDEAVRAEGCTFEWIDTAVAAPLLPPRRRAAHKGDFGHLLAVAGSRGKSGAAVLLARAALRSGVGLMTVAAPESARGEIAVQQAELMTESLAETQRGGLDEAASARAADVLARCDALAVGPGLGTDAPTVAAVRALLAGTPRPTVIDADGLNAFVGVVDTLMRPADSPPLVLTPHPGEAARLLGRPTTEVQDDRLGAVTELSRRTGAWIVLKGRHTLLAAPDGRLAANGTGNPGMASGGSGDVLTGILGAFLARGLGAWDALRLGVWAHGAAGDRAAARLGEDGAIAGDLIGELPAVLAGLKPC